MLLPVDHTARPLQRGRCGLRAATDAGSDPNAQHRVVHSGQALQDAALRGTEADFRTVASRDRPGNQHIQIAALLSYPAEFALADEVLENPEIVANSARREFCGQYTESRAGRCNQHELAGDLRRSGFDVLKMPTLCSLDRRAESEQCRSASERQVRTDQARIYSWRGCHIYLLKRSARRRTEARWR